MKYKRGGTTYANAIGRIRVKERMLFNRPYLISLAEANGSVDVMEMLAKTSYAKYFDKSPPEMDYKEIIKRKWMSVRNLYRKFSLGDAVGNLLWGRHDLSNVKILLKSKYLGIEPEELSELGNISLEKLKSYILADKKSAVPSWIDRGVAAVRKKFEISKDPRDISLVMDREYFSLLRRHIGIESNKFLKDLLIVEIDLHNIKVFLRIKGQSNVQKFLDEGLVEGGSKRKRFYVDLAGASPDKIIGAYANTVYSNFVKEGIQIYDKEKSFWRIEKMADNHLLNFVKQVKHAAFGFEPLIAYVFARRNEEKALRLIMEGKLTGVTTDFIKERIPGSYV